MTPFPLDGGRVGDGGDTVSGKPTNTPKPTHAPGAVQRARRLRREATLGERILWGQLRKLKMNFRRQAPIGRYIVDFVQYDLKLILEVDGPHHALPEVKARDAVRTAWLESQGFRVLRFYHLDVVNDPGVVLQAIAAAAPPSPALPPSRGKGV